MNILVTVKNEYLIRVKNLLTKLIFDGLNSIYAKTREASVDDDVLKVFQSLLKRVPKWTDEILNNEVIRIRGLLDLDNNFDLLNDLIKALIKANYNIMVFGSEINFDVNGLLDEFSFKEFIKNIYIESSREIYNNPFLFYHNSPPVDIKRNQRDVLNIIGNSIEESIRKLLPIKIILDAYLNNNNKIFKVVYPSDVLDNSNDDNAIDNFVKNDLVNDPFNVKIDKIPNNFELPLNNQIQVNSPRPNNEKIIPNPLIPSSRPELLNNSPNNLIMRGGNDSSVKILNSEVKLDKSSDENSVQNKILDIINEKSLDLNPQTNISEFENTNSNKNESAQHNLKGGNYSNDTDLRHSNTNTNSNTNSHSNSHSNTNSCNETFIAKDEHHSSINNLSNHKNSNSNNDSNKVEESVSNKMNKINRSQSELDSKLEKLLKNDLGDSDTDSTLVVDNQSNYQEVFSNSNSSHDSSLNSQQKNEEINKNKFFANYLNI